MARRTWRTWLPAEASSATGKDPPRGGAGLARGVLVTVLCGFLALIFHRG